jgi:hypothetical protein
MKIAPHEHKMKSDMQNSAQQAARNANDALISGPAFR